MYGPGSHGGHILLNHAMLIVMMLMDVVMRSSENWMPGFLQIKSESKFVHFDCDCAVVRHGMHGHAGRDKVYLEVFSLGPIEDVVKLLDTFPQMSQLDPPFETVVISRSFSNYLLSTSVTNIYAIPEDVWGWHNISTPEATLQADQYWHEGVCICWQHFVGGSWCVTMFPGCMQQYSVLQVDSAN